MDDTLVRRGHEAASRGDWRTAYDLFMEADAEQRLPAADFALFADVAYASGHIDVTIEVWERTYAQSLRAGDRFAAAGAATRVAMHLMFDTALMAPVRGWITRAERLLEEQGETPVHAWLAIIRNYERLLSGDFLEARKWARRGIEIGDHCNPAAAALGRIAEARSLILDGEVQEGLELLNDAAVATVSGEIDPLTIGIVYCELVCALQALAQYDLAEEWTQAMERWRHGQPVGSLHGRCRVHRAEILRLRGANSEAEKEALLACDELRPYLRREFGWPLTELGNIRLRRGDLGGAEQAFEAARQVGWDPQPGLAMTYLARGDVALASASIRDALEHPAPIPSKELPPNTELRRAPLLEAQVEIAVAAGDVERARWASDALQEIASTFGSKALLAGWSAADAQVRLAEGDTLGARAGFESAMQLWSEIGAPYETALARMGIAQTHRGEGNMECALRDFMAAGLMFENVGAADQAERAARASALLRSEPSSEPRGQTPSMEAALPIGTAVACEDNAFRRAGEYWTVKFAGQTLLLRDAKGLRYLACLLAAPGREIHVLDLIAIDRGGMGGGGFSAEHGLLQSSLGDAGEMLDDRAKSAYRRRLTEIEEDIEESRAAGNVERELQADAERAFLIRELSRAVGLGGRDRRAGSASERARVSVTRAVRSAITRIRKQSPPLAVHLDRCIRTGRYCAYLPDPLTPSDSTWLISR